MKRKIFICSLIVICLCIAAFGTLAYFSYEDTATNVITAGNVRIELQEWTVSRGGERLPFRGEIDVFPGMEVSQIAEIKNTGLGTAWIRVSVDKAITLAQGVEGQVDLSLLELDYDTEHWALRDGYFYYLEPLSAGQVTQPLFTEVTFAEAMGNMYQYSKAVVTVNAQAVQTANNGADVFAAAGWPAGE